MVIDTESGCRISSLKLLGMEILVAPNGNPFTWGLYPMAPWAGRTRHGRFRFDGETYSLPINLTPHAAHGTVFHRPWRVVEPPSLFECDLGPDWPFPGRVRQHIELGDDYLSQRLEVHSEGPAMPAACGWHPWFLSRIGGAEVSLRLDAGFMEVRDSEGIPNGERVPPPPGPWDDCFGDLRSPPRLVWGDVLQLDIESNCDYAVVYNELPHAVCVEPQTAPPDALNRSPALVTPDSPLVAVSKWSWRRPSAS